MSRLLVCLIFIIPTFALADDKPTKPKKPEGPVAEAKQRWLRGNYEEARAQFEKLLGDEKTHSAAAIGIARAWRSEGNDAKALAAINDALKQDDKSADLLAFRANILYNTGRWDDAVKDAEAAIQIKPEQFLAHWVCASISRYRRNEEGRCRDAVVRPHLYPSR